MFDVFLKELNDNGGSVRAYDAVARAARARIATEPQNAAALLLISAAAQQFVDAYDDQPLTSDAATEELSRFSALVTSLDKAYTSGSFGDQLKALNEVATVLVNQRA